MCVSGVEHLLLFEQYSVQVWVGVDIHWLPNDGVICVVGLSRAMEDCGGRKLLWTKIGLHAGLLAALLSPTLTLFPRLLRFIP